MQNRNVTTSQVRLGLFRLRMELRFGWGVVSPEGVHVARDVGQPLRVVDSRIEGDGWNELCEPPDLL